MRRGAPALASVAVIAFVLASLATFAGARPAAAQSNAPTKAADPQGAEEGARAKARRLAAEGLRHFQAGRYADAIHSFEAAYALDPSALLLYDLAQAHRLAGDCGQALDDYRRFLAADPPAELRGRAEARRADMERCVAKNGAPASPPAASAPVPAAAPGPPAPAVPAPGQSAGGPPLRAPPVQAVVPDRPSEPGAGPVRRLFSRRKVSVGLAVIGAALGGAAFYYGDRALSAADATTRLEHDGGAWTQAAADRERDGVRSQTYAIVFGTAALVAAAAAVWLLVTGPAHRGVN